MKISTPEYTAELDISGRMKVVVLIALEVRYGVNAWMERRKGGGGRMSSAIEDVC